MGTITIEHVLGFMTTLISGAAIIWLGILANKFTQNKEEQLREKLDRQIRFDALIYAIEKTHGERESPTTIKEVYEKRVALLRDNYSFIHDKK